MRFYLAGLCRIISGQESDARPNFERVQQYSKMRKRRLGRSRECVSVSSSSDLKQDVRSCVRSVKIQKLYETFVVNETDRVAISLATISSA